MSNGMWEMASEEAVLARAFVKRLGQVSARLLSPAVPPILHRDPYLSAWTNVQAALANAPETDRERVAALADELDGQLNALRLDPLLAEAARRAVRALLARRWLLTPESFTFVFEPFESVVPLSSLQS